VPAWCGDDIGFDAADDWYATRGDSWRESSEPCAPVVRHPIGFVVGVRKPRVRVKAWTVPVIRND
jgi:hypothetical protein